MKDLIKGLNENRVSNSLVVFFFFTFDTYMLTKWFCKEIIMQSRFMERKKYSKILGMPFWQLHIWFLILGWLWRPMGLLYYGCIDFLSCFGRQVKEFFGAGTACVVSPVEKILYKSQWLDIPTMSEGAPLTMRMYNTLLDIQVIHFILSHTFIANHAVSSRLEYR